MVDLDQPFLMLIAAPALVVGVLALAFAGGRIARGGAGALAAFVLAVLAIVGLGAGASGALGVYAKKTLIPACEQDENAAQARGETVLFDCESEGLIAVFPVIAALGALALFVAGAGLIFIIRPRQRSIDD